MKYCKRYCMLCFAACHESLWACFLNNIERERDIIMLCDCAASLRKTDTVQDLFTKPVQVIFKPLHLLCNYRLWFW